MNFKSVTCFLFLVLAFSCKQRQNIDLLIPEEASERIRFGAERLSQMLDEHGFKVTFKSPDEYHTSNRTIALFVRNSHEDKLLQEDLGIQEGIPDTLHKEGFRIRSSGKVIYVQGMDESGVLYGALTLGEHLTREGQLDFDHTLSDHPEMKLRGTAIGLQKTTYLPGRGVYEYPYTPENFPWFYDKKLWLDYLDMLVDNRMNSLYLWNGHPFASLVKLEDYPYALEVDEETFRQNEEIFSFLTKEADKRGIWIIQMFYNVIVSKPFADHHGIVTQDRNRPLDPLLADYTKKSIAAFIEKYPNVGLLVALGEAMQGEENDVKWFTETVIPGVKDGLKSLGTTEEPPIILRAHDTNGPLVMEKALPIYQNLYTMHKYNGESLTTYEPRGPWAKIHTDLSKAAPVHISNVHILANLEPFRYGSPDFIQKSVQAMHEVHHANALHLYPQASYWDWPYSADKVTDRLLQIDRDWIWYKAWGRYAWNRNRPRGQEITFWSEEIGEKYGSKEAGKYILQAYEETGEIAPKLLRRFGITEGNRQTLLLGMFGSQLVNPYKWRVYPGFYESCGPEGEILIEFAEKEAKGEPHIGETPPQIIREVVEHGENALKAIEEAADLVKTDKEEFERLRNDVHAYKFFADFFADKVNASLWVLRYSHSGNLEDLEKALPLLESSVEHYRHLANITKDTYLYANSMQTAQRRIPIGGNDGKNKTWEEMLPHYQRELENFSRNLSLLKESSTGKLGEKEIEVWQPVALEWIDGPTSMQRLEKGLQLFNDVPSKVTNIADEIKSLPVWQRDAAKQQEAETLLRFKTDRKVKLVVGFFNTDQQGYLFPPSLETDAAGNVRGQAEVLLANALAVENHPRINIHTYLFEPGEQELRLDKGKVLIFGFIDGETEIHSRDAGIIGEVEKEAVDWVFY